ncbi:hypothetical protein N7478_008092 [Penicillium angulare]|uniref:uncharacterized protein n=1 Tax=Penicillium angulare TaxID=116970 RepID=UPI002540D188|nr:uncharacterized protein N7478_008092 [Penicillium angulare]KAJ5272967.1 hypothetical protein N7478_008092 [Penicillium angulare]
MRPLYSCAHVATRKSSYPGPDWGDPVEPVEPVEEEPKYTSPIELFDTPDFVTDARSAIVLHCATGRNYSGEAELLRVSAVDFYSGEVLIDTLVSPYGMLLHTDQRNSGISSAMLDNAEKIGYISEDRNAVREALFKFVNPQTTLIVHNGQQLLWLLRWIHLRIIDAYELQKRRFGERAPWDLSQLTSDLLCRRVGQNNRNDNLENVFAIRDCVHWFAVNMPEAHRKEPEELILKYPSRHRTDEERRVFWGRWHHEWRWFARIQWDCLC